MVLKAANVLVTALMLISMAYRYGHCFDSEKKDPGFKAFFFFLENTFFLVGILLFAATLLPDTNKASQIVRLWLNFLDNYFGRGMFIFFASFYMLEMKTFLQVFLFITVNCIAFCEIIVGWK